MPFLIISVVTSYIHIASAIVVQFRPLVNHNGGNVVVGKLINHAPLAGEK
jgi:hypothetical protein